MDPAASTAGAAAYQTARSSDNSVAGRREHGLGQCPSRARQVCAYAGRAIYTSYSNVGGWAIAADRQVAVTRRQHTSRRQNFWIMDDKLAGVLFPARTTMTASAGTPQYGWPWLSCGPAMLGVPGARRLPLHIKQQVPLWSGTLPGDDRMSNEMAVGSVVSLGASPSNRCWGRN